MISVVGQQQTPVLVEQITAQPFWVSVILVSAVIFLIMTVLGSLKVSLLVRLLILVPLLLVVAVVYFQNGPLVATVALSVGFLLSFVLAFVQIGGPRT